MSQHRIRISAAAAALVLASGCSAEGQSPAARPEPSANSTAPEASTVSGAATNAPCEPLPDLPRDRIAYTHSREDGSTALYLMKPDGTDRRCLVDTDGPDSWPAWSPDGRRLAFVGSANGADQVFIVRASGTGLRQVTDSPQTKESLVWSPDGLRIGYTASVSPDFGPFSIRLVEVDGSDEKLIAASHPPDVEYVELLDWSPDARTILYAAAGGGGTGLWTMTPAGRTKAFLRGEPGDFGSGAKYSPDGTSLAFQADLDGGCIFQSDTQAQHLSRLTRGCSEGFTLDWSPDGRWIVWGGGAHGPADAEVMAADGSQRHTIVDDSSVAYPTWQPRLQD